MEKPPSKKQCKTSATDAESAIAAAETCETTFVFGEPSGPVLKAVSALEGEHAPERHATAKHKHPDGTERNTMETHTTPLWLATFRQREAEGDRELRPRLIQEWKKHAGIDEAMALQILDGVPAHSNIVDHIAEWVLGMPAPDALRACEECAWQGMEKETGSGFSCPQCGQGTHRLPPVF